MSLAPNRHHVRRHSVLEGVIDHSVCCQRSLWECHVNALNALGLYQVSDITNVLAEQIRLNLFCNLTSMFISISYMLVIHTTKSTQHNPLALRFTKIFHAQQNNELILNLASPSLQLSVESCE